MKKLIIKRITGVLPRLAVMLLISLVFLGAGCNSEDGVRQSLSRHQNQWVSQSIESYRYQLGITCFCLVEISRPVTIEVRNGATHSVSYLADGTAADAKYFEKYDTIDELFLIIDDAIDQKADEIKVTYDEELGFPTRIHIDFMKEAVDDEMTYDITEFQILE